MQTITLDIINNKAIPLLQNLESLELIKIHQNKEQTNIKIDWAKKYKGAMSKQPISDIDKQLNEMRNEWE